MIDLSEDQQRAVERILEWIDRGTPFSGRLSLGGYAGTGKSTLVRYLLDEIHLNIAVCAYTGKAASVLQRKGVPASTAHRLIYVPETVCIRCDRLFNSEGVCPVCKSRERGETHFMRVPFLQVDLVIVDEASMLSERIVRDIESFGVPTLYVGDHGQLEPIGRDPGILRDPDIRLERIHRQAEGSPIIRFAHHVREGADPCEWTNTEDVAVRHGIEGADLLSYDAILCGYNRTRVAVNARIRKLRGFGDEPEEGERLICLQNDAKRGLFNGMLATIVRRREDRKLSYILDLETEDGQELLKIPALKSQFGQERKPEDRVSVGLFDYGYCMTVHKAQGSEWDNVAVLEQISPSWTATRWRYTAATRAARTLHYFLSPRSN